MAPKRPKRPKKPKKLRPVDYNIGGRGDLFRVIALPLVPAGAPGHPFRGRARINITPFVEAISWGSSKDEAGVIKGTITVRNPANVLGVLVPGSRIQVKQATKLISNASANAIKNRRYVKVLELVIQSREKQQVEFLLQLDCADRLFYLNQGKHDFNFKAKKGKKGKTASEIIRAVCKQERIPFTKTSIPKTKLPLEKQSGSKVTVLAFLTQVLKAHNKRVDKANGKRPAPPNWNIHMREGHLTIKPIKPPRSVWFLDERNFLSEPSYQESTKELATRVTVTGKNTTYKKKFNKDGSESKRKKAVKSKVSKTVEDVNMIRAYGVIHHTERVSGKLTPEKALRMARSILSKRARIQRSLSFTCPALPGIWVGSKVYLHCPTYGMRGYFTVTSFQYDISGPNGATMNITIDAGSRPVTADAVPDLLRITKARILGKHRDAQGNIIPAGRTVKVVWSDKSSKTHTHAKRLRVAKVVIRHAADVSQQDLSKKGETVVVHYANGKRYVFANKFNWPKGLVAATDEGYITNAKVTG